MGSYKKQNEEQYTLKRIMPKIGEAGWTKKENTVQ